MIAADVSQDPPIWEPSPDIVQRTTMAAFLRQHRLTDLEALLSRADEEPDWYWNALFDFFDIQFVTPYEKVLDVSNGIAWPRWCVGGATNLVLNCLDRHRDTPVWKKAAIIWEGEDGQRRSWNYAQLDAEVCRLAAVLKSRDLKIGDVVAIYMPMIPEAAAAFLAIAKIGAIAMPLFSGFGPQPISDRLIDADARAVLTVDVGRRRGKLLPMKETLDRALAAATSAHTVVVLVRESEAQSSSSSRDVTWPSHSDVLPAVQTEIVDAETPVMLMYSSGTTGKPKGTIHTHCGMLAKNALDLGLCVDLKESDRLLWMSDMGWIVGPKIVVSATLLGATLVLAEGTPDWPDEERMWKLAANHRVTVIGIVPTMVRQMMRRGPEILAGCDLSALRTTISIGEPWTQDAWIWFFEHVCKRRIPILNYAGGTECGGAILISSFLSTLRPCAFGHAVPGCGADVVDASGQSLPAGAIGELIMRRPSIGMTRGLWRAPERYVESYWNIIPSVWVQGDLASRDSHGGWYLHGRSDDTIKIAGKRTGPSEIETALMATGLLADAAVVGVPDPITGSALACACVPLAQTIDNADLARRLAQAVSENFGASYRPKHFIFIPELPRTRNQKVMRRVIRGVLTGAPLGDLSSLANPESIETLRSHIRLQPDAMRPATNWGRIAFPSALKNGIPKMANAKKDPKYKDILFEVVDQIAWLTINREHTLNACRELTLDEITAAVRSTRDDPSIACVVITGAGDRSFCSGGDFASMKRLNWVAGAHWNDRMLGCAMAIRGVSIPVIAMVNGWCMGGGNELALWCDVVVASENAVFGQTGARVGACPTVGATQYLPRIIGERLAREMIFCARKFTAKEAVEIGLANHCVPAPELRPRTLELCETIKSHSSQTLRMTKVSLNHESDNLYASWRAGMEFLSHVWGSEESLEGMNAFVEKRKPDFNKFRMRNKKTVDEYLAGVDFESEDGLKA